MFTARPPDGPATAPDLPLIAAQREVFTGPSLFLADAGNRARVAEYLTDMARPYDVQVGSLAAERLGHSYGEMAEPLIAALVPPEESVDLLILAFSVHDGRPGRPTAAYLSHVTPGSPMAFAICDQGSAAAFSGLRIAREYVRTAGVRRALLIIVEQAALPYDGGARVPSQHQGIAMLYGARAGAGAGADPLARVTGSCQHPGVPPDQVADLAAAGLAKLTVGHRQVALVQGGSLAAVWPEPGPDVVRVMPPDQPMTGVWWGVIDELGEKADEPFVVVAADYDPDLRYLSLTAFAKEPAQWETP